MDKYRKAYYILMSEIDKALTLLDTEDLMEYDNVRQILYDAMQEVEEIFIGDENY